MKKMFALLCVLLFSCSMFSYSQCPLLYTCPQPAAYPASIEELWEKAMYQQMKVLEKKFGVLFDTAWSPRVSFIMPQDEYVAQYERLTHTFTFIWYYQNAIYELLKQDSITEIGTIITSILGHELGHALADQVSYRIRCKPWPDSAAWENGTKRDRMVQKILSEGVGNYFGGLLVTDTLGKLSSLPEKKKWCVWRPSDWMYNGGYWVVQPILGRFGQDGLVYIITHTTFPGRGYNLRKAGKKYQRRALKKLKQAYSQPPIG